MNVILVPKIGGRRNTVRLGNKWLILIGFIMLGIVTAFVAGGFYIGRHGQELHPADYISAMQQVLSRQRDELDNARRDATENLDALAMRLGKLQSHVIRLDSLGERLTVIAQLDSGEFDFSQQPAQGGPVNLAGRKTFTVPDFVESLTTLSSQLEDRAQQLGLLETLMMSHNLEHEVVPAGRPIKKGWLSSYFGLRTDPFSGKQERHKGLDFAGKMGSNVVAVAAGVVTWASKRYGYGQLVEVNHGNGYATRYGHSHKILVKVGDKVEKGDQIALMGSSGRSTGPHVHFEVLKDGRAVNPIDYISKQ